MKRQVLTLQMKVNYVSVHDNDDQEEEMGTGSKHYLQLVY
jgi:hypothetical protein